MKKHNKSFLIILVLMFGAKMVSAQEVELNPRFLTGVGFSFPYSLKSKKLHEGFGFDVLHFFKDEKLYAQLGFSSTYFQQEKKSDKWFVRSHPFMLSGGVRLNQSKKVSFYLNGGAGIAVSTEDDFTGASYQGGVKMLCASNSCGRTEINLNYIYYKFDKKEEAISLGFVYWFAFPKLKRK